MFAVFSGAVATIYNEHFINGPFRIYYMVYESAFCGRYNGI